MSAFRTLLSEFTAGMPARAYHRNELGQFKSPAFRAKVRKAESLISDRGYSVEELFSKLQAAVEIVAHGYRPSLVITGTSGAGKTKLVSNVLSKVGLKRSIDYVPVKGTITAAALYQTLFLNRNKLLVFDDTDSIWRDKDAAAILKAALDSYDTRTVSWISTRTANVSRMTPRQKKAFIKSADASVENDPKAKYPSEFEFTGRIIFISNLDKSQLDNAVLSRSMVVDVSLTPEEIFDRIRSMIGQIGNKNLSVEQKTEILNTLTSLHAQGKLRRGVSVRTFVAATELMASGYKNWEMVIDLV